MTIVAALLGWFLAACYFVDSMEQRKVARVALYDAESWKNLCQARERQLQEARDVELVKARVAALEDERWSRRAQAHIEEFLRTLDRAA